MKDKDMEKSVKKQIGVGAVLSYIAIALNIIAGLVFTPIIIRYIGQSDYAIYTLANSLMALLTIDFGLSSAVTKFVAQYRIEGDEGKVNSFLSTIFRLYLIIDMVIILAMVVMFCCVDTIYVNLSPKELLRLKMVFIITGVSTAVSFPFIPLNGIISAYEKFIQLKTVDIIYRILTIALMLLAIITNQGLYGIVLATSFSGLIAIGIKIRFIRSKIRVRISISDAKQDGLGYIAKFSLFTTINSLASRLIFSIMPTILGNMASSIAIARFGLASTIEGYSYILTNAINGLFMPRISEMYAKNESETSEPRILSIMVLVGRYQYALSALITVGFALIGKDFITLWVGPGYENVFWGTILIMLPSVFYNPMEIANTAFIVKNKVHLTAFVAVTTGIINVILSLCLVPELKEKGAFISISIAYWIRVLLITILCKTKLNINMKLFFKKCYLRMSIPLAITFALGLVANLWLNKTSWTILAIKTFIICFIYLIATAIFGISRTERKQIFLLIRNVGAR